MLCLLHIIEQTLAKLCEAEVAVMALAHAEKIGHTRVTLSFSPATPTAAPAADQPICLVWLLRRSL